MSVETAWRNRIIGTGDADPEQLLANERNYRIHPKHQQDALAGVLDQVGWVQQVMVNHQTGAVVDGHLRVSLALQRGEPSVPVTYVDLTPDEEALILATLDPITGLAGVDAEQLEALLDQVETENESLSRFLDDLAESEGITEHGPPSLDDLAQTHTEPDASDFWPVIKIKVSPEDHQRYRAMIADLPGETEDEQFVALLDLIQDTVEDR